jgi:anti-sigma28 factor (negative regulator of flagellin synthesis)
MAAHAARRKRAHAPEARPATPVRDTFEPSAEIDREAKLAKIKQRIRNGYYNSAEVTDDLSDSFAKVLDKLV